MELVIVMLREIHTCSRAPFVVRGGSGWVFGKTGERRRLLADF